jgi:iron complex outermembrane recepter protein
MSELIQKNDSRASIRWKLLTSASALALAGYIASADAAAAADSDRPQIWIELGGQFEQMNDPWERFAPHFVSQIDTSVFPSPIEAQRPPGSAVSLDGKLSFQPEDSDWVFSAAVQFGRSSAAKHVEHQTSPASAVEVITFPYVHLYHRTGKTAPLARQFVDASARIEEHHRILDFQAGKDVGLGLFGGNGSSLVNVGVRFAQFTSTSKAMIAADPDFHFTYKYIRGYGRFPSLYLKIPRQGWHDYVANEDISRSFHGIGPSLSWQASVPFAGNAETTELTLDWGASAALLFGRQRTKVHHQTTGRYKSVHAFQSVGPVTYQPPPFDKTRSRSVTVPNVGGSLGLSFRYPNAKISIGYRADFFFGAEDGGIDTRKSENRSFYGPFASISIGVGD